MSRLRRAGIAGLLILALLLAADFAAWSWVTGRMLGELTAWQALRAAEGLQIQSAPPYATGWPFAAAIELPAVTADARLATWQADGVRLSLSAFHPTTLLVTAQGGQSLRFGGSPPIAITAVRLAVAVDLSHPQSVGLAGRSITVDTGSGLFAADSVAGQVDGAGASLSASGIVIPGVALPVIDGVSLQLHATSPLPVQPSPAAAATAWAKTGAQLVVDAATLRVGKVDVQGQLTAGLDPDLQPSAHGTLHVTGYREAVDSLVHAGVISGRAGMVATTMLGLMATGSPAVDVPFAVQAGIVTLGGIPLARLPPLTWP